MPFPLLLPLIMGGLGVGGSILGSKLAKSNRSPLEQQVLESNLAGQKQGQQIATESIPQARNLLSMSQSGMQQPMSYWASILSGNRAGIQSAMAPDIRRINEGYNAAAQTSSVLTPRGGPRADVLADQPFQRQRDISTLMQTARPQAASSLFQAGAQSGAQGSNLFSNAIQAIYGSTAAGRDILASEAQRREAETSSGKSIGGFLFELMKQLDLSGLGKSGGGGGKGSGGILSDAFTSGRA